MAVNNVVNLQPVVTGTTNQIAVVNAADNTTSTISLSSNVITTSQPRFSAYLSTTKSNVSGDGTPYTIICDTATINQPAGTPPFSTSTGLFTAPVAGNYLFTASVIFQIGTVITSYDAQLFKSSGSLSYLLELSTSGVGATVLKSAGGSVILPLILNETVSFIITLTGTVKNSNVSGANGPIYTYFSGSLLV